MIMPVFFKGALCSIRLDDYDNIEENHPSPVVVQPDIYMVQVPAAKVHRQQDRS